MDNLCKHIYRVGQHQDACSDDGDLEEPKKLRKKIEPWLCALFQSEHLSLLLGSGFTTALGDVVDAHSGSMGIPDFNDLSEGPDEEDHCLEEEANEDRRSEEKDEALGQILTHAHKSAKRIGRGSANIEDYIRSLGQAIDGLNVFKHDLAADIRAELDRVLRDFMQSILASERGIRKANGDKRIEMERLLQSFLLSFASRAVGRDRLHIFTTNYDRLIEYGSDMAGLHLIDRFVGQVSPRFRSSRLDVDIHYNPPGIRGEPRYLEGVVHLSKLHGSVDWAFDDGSLRRIPVSFGAEASHPDLPDDPSETIMIYPNPAKDVETLLYPYAELLRDFAAAICRPNSTLVTYGYGFGDDHINRILADMLTIPSTHLVIIAWDDTDPENPNEAANSSRKRINRFRKSVGREAQISLLLGKHFGHITNLVDHYLPKPALDEITKRAADLLEQRNMPEEGEQ